MKRIVCYAIGLVFAATHAFAGVAPVPKPFHAGEEQTDARMIYVGGSDSGGKLAIDNHAEFMVARDESNVSLNWCNAWTFKWSFGFFSFDGPRSEYPQFQADVNGSPAGPLGGSWIFTIPRAPIEQQPRVSPVLRTNVFQCQTRQAILEFDSDARADHTTWQ